MKNCLKVLLASFLVINLCSCVISFREGYCYSNPECYDVGPASFSEDVTNLDIDWICGNVRLVYGDAKTIEIYEETNGRHLPMSYQLHYWLDGSTLRIRYCRSGALDCSEFIKTLYVVFPKNHEFRKVSVEAVSSAVLMRGLVSDNLTVKTVSGSIELEDYCEIYGDCKFDTVSGKIIADLGKTNNLKVGTVSGKVNVKADVVKDTKINTTSGGISMIYFLENPKTLKADSLSGAVYVEMPVDSGFYADLDSISGSIRVDDRFRCRGYDDIWYCGDEYSNIKINTTSGSITLASCRQ